MSIARQPLTIIDGTVSKNHLSVSISEVVLNTLDSKVRNTRKLDGLCVKFLNFKPLSSILQDPWQGFISSGKLNLGLNDYQY